jgi:hypothetical protein
MQAEIIFQDYISDQAFTLIIKDSRKEITDKGLFRNEEDSTENIASNNRISNHWYNRCVFINLV